MAIPGVGDAFAQGPWGAKYPAIAQSWRRNWELVIPFFAFPEGVRRIIYTTNAIEALNSKLRRAVRTRGHFPSDDAATKLLYLVLNRAKPVEGPFERPATVIYYGGIKCELTFPGDGRKVHSGSARWLRSRCLPCCRVRPNLGG
jgi:Transposase, Mutator family